MNEQEYYKQINELIETYEVNSKVRYIQDNHEKLLTNWKIEKTLVEAQGGLNRAKYGDRLIRKWSNILSSLYGNQYGYTNLKNMKQFYLIFRKGRTLCDQLSWSHYRYLLPIKNESERNYYINQVVLNNLSVRELRELIKSKAYNRLSFKDKENIFGNNYSKQNLMFYRAFYSSFPNVNTLCSHLSWSHYRYLLPRLLYTNFREIIHE